MSLVGKQSLKQMFAFSSSRIDYLSDDIGVVFPGYLGPKCSNKANDFEWRRAVLV